MLNQIEARFSDLVSQFSLPTATRQLDARLKLLERQDRSAKEEISARSVEAQLFVDPALLQRAKERLILQPVRLARHICASLLAVMMMSGLASPVHANPPSSVDYTTTPSDQASTSSPSLLDIIEELIEDTIEDLICEDDDDPTEGTH